MMIEGGNAKAREAFGENVLNLKDLKSKYTSNSSTSYKEKLQKRAREHDTFVTETPVDNLIYFDTVQPSLIDFDYEPSVPVETSMDDFDIFKPIPTKTTPTTPSIFDELSHNLLIDDAPAAPASNAAVDNFFDQFEKPATPKRTFKPKTTHHRATKLGARKVQSNVFQQQNELALQEEKMREQGIDQESIDRSSRNQLMISNSKPIPKLQPPSTRLNYEPTKVQETEVQTIEERLGMMSLASIPKKEEISNEDTFARDKFGNAKAISSDQYFGRNDYPKTDIPSFGKKKTPISKKILKAASNKIQNMLADMEVSVHPLEKIYAKTLVFFR